MISTNNKQDLKALISSKLLRGIKKVSRYHSPKAHTSVVVAIPTYNRPELLKRLLRQIDSAAKTYNVTVIVIDDGSTVPVSLATSEFNNIGHIDLYRSDRNNGKRGYWITVNNMFNLMSQVEAEYYFYLGDDLEVNDTFFDDAISRWNAIKDPRKISLNLLNDGRDVCWTKFKRQAMNMGEYNIYLSQWLDMIMMMDKKMLAHRVEPIKAERWALNPDISSGVGSQLSQRFFSRGYTMYQVANSLVFHGEHESVMNPEARASGPLVSIL